MREEGKMILGENSPQFLTKLQRVEENLVGSKTFGSGQFHGNFYGPKMMVFITKQRGWGGIPR